jgi:hypothetical protein
MEVEKLKRKKEVCSTGSMVGCLSRHFFAGKMTLLVAYLAYFRAESWVAGCAFGCLPVPMFLLSL